MMKYRGADVITLAFCIGKGTPIAFPFPNRDLMLRSIRAKLGEDFPILNYTTG